MALFFVEFESAVVGIEVVVFVELLSSVAVVFFWSLLLFFVTVLVVLLVVAVFELTSVSPSSDARLGKATLADVGSDIGNSQW